MIIGKIHQGSGLGNQLFRYVMTRTLALDKETDFGFIGIENFKGNSFMNLDWGKPVTEPLPEYHELRVDNEDGVDVRSYDKNIKHWPHNCIIDGEFQGEKYWNHRLPEIREWLKVEPMEMPDNLCVINFRGGEYKGFPDLYLTKNYWREAIDMMIKVNSDMKFEVHTDDVLEAKKFFPNFVCISNIGINWRAVRHAKYLILSNSSFGILPALLNEKAKHIIAPKYWARRNKGFWALPYNEYKGWKYI